ncbi:HIT family protein [Amycolatopsis vastitatis]|uniref:HIT family protein n=1 Tax=Amycolatopsis vastitatis TaxID=1905142 RepID=A0A229TDV3_9PSEU|nr:HIT family protein [Amycolatopsis vastitatis]
MSTNGLIAVIDDAYPVSFGHKLVVPRRHVVSPFDLTSDESLQVWRMIRDLREKMMANDSSIEGFNVGFNSGRAAGQTVLHAHIHLIPRRIGDTPEPRGGVRGVIPARMAY